MGGGQIGPPPSPFQSDNVAWSYKVRSPADSPWISETPVGYRPQILTLLEQAQARENIGAGTGGGYETVISVPGDYNTITEAKAAYTAGSVIEVGPGDWFETNLAKAGVQIHYNFIQGAKLRRTVAHSPAFFDDGDGTSTGDAPGINADMDVVVTGQGIFSNETASGHSADVMNLIRAGSRLILKGDLCQTIGFFNPPVGQGAGSMYVEMREIVGLLSGAIYWGGGNAVIVAHEKIHGGGSGGFAIYGSSPAGTHWTIKCPYVESLLGQAEYYTGAGKVWREIGRTYGAEGGVDQDEGFVYHLGTGKVEAGITSPRAAFNQAGGTSYGYLQKIEGGNPSGTGCLNVSAGLCVLDILQIIDTGMTVTPTITVSGGEAKLRILDLDRTTTGTGISQSGGALSLLAGTKIDTSVNTAGIAYTKSGGTACIDAGVKLIAGATGKSIDAATSQTVIGLDFTVNKDVDSDIIVDGEYTINTNLV